MSAGLEIVSLGGCGGFGMNATLLVSEGRSLLVDYGTGFPSGIPAGVSKIVSDVAMVEDQLPAPSAIVVTHGHDDHAAGIAFLPESWRHAPLHGPAFALALVADRFEERGLSRPRMNPLRSGESFESLPFRVHALEVTHSIPESLMLAIETPEGLVVHSGDYRFDDAPVIGAPTDLATLESWGRQGVRLLLTDSTGAMREDDPGLSESSVAESLEKSLVGARGQVVVSTFASQLHRLVATVRAARRLGRKAAPLGMRMQRMLRLGRQLGLFELPAGSLLNWSDLAELPPEERIWLCGGCQGEPESTLNRLSFDTHARAGLREDDRVVITASVIPGSELPYARMTDRLLRLGVELIDPRVQSGLHYSGHGPRHDIRRLIEVLRPEAVVPVHGERRHLEACAALAESAAPAPRQIALVELGGRLRLEGRALREEKPLFITPRSLDEAGETVPIEVIRERRRLSECGVVAIRVEGAPGAVRAVEANTCGVAGPEPVERRNVEDAALDAANAAIAEAPSPGESVEERIARRVGRALKGQQRRRVPVLVVGLGEQR